MQKQHRFGWMNKKVHIKSSQFEISPLHEFDVAISEVIEHPKCDAWLEMPSGCNRFELPASHYLEVDSTAINDDLAILLISVFGFLHGLNLKPCGVGHLHRTPHLPGTLVEFVPSYRDIEKVLKVVIEFYQRYSSQPETISLMMAAIHWYLTSQSYNHHFEQFAWQYAVLENAIKIASKLSKRKFADSRLSELAAYYNVNLHVAFADPEISAKNAKALVECRNKLMHEALWCDHPIGYTVSQKSYAMLRSLIRFNSQLILAILGVKCRFLEADDDRQRWPLSVT
jgi:hypothetical protein